MNARFAARRRARPFGEMNPLPGCAKGWRYAGVTGGDQRSAISDQERRRDLPAVGSLFLIADRRSLIADSANLCASFPSYHEPFG
jgi:hypothetical protein